MERRLTVDEPTTDFDQQLGARIAEARRAAGLTQTELGDRIGLTRSSVANIEGARQHILAASLITIGRALDVDPRWLLTGDTYAPRTNPARRLTKADIAQIHRATGTLRAVAECLDILAGDPK